MIEDRKETDKALAPEDLKLLVEFFTLLAECDAAEKKKVQEMNFPQENGSLCSRPSLEASLNSLRS